MVAPAVADGRRADEGLAYEGDVMDFSPTPKVQELQAKLTAFMDEHIYPNEATIEAEIEASGDPYHHPQLIEDLKQKARAQGLWNLFLPDARYGAGLTNL
jgi:acyl-CoA dehydrogenase